MFNYEWACGTDPPVAIVRCPNYQQHRNRRAQLAISRVCTPAAVGLRLMGAVLQWTSICDALDSLLSNDRRMVSQENTTTFICDNTFTTPNPCYSEILKDFSLSSNGSFSVMFTQEYSLQDPAPIDCTYGIPSTPLGQIPISPGNGFKGSMSPFGSKCQSMSVNSGNCINTTMSLGVLPCNYI